MRTRLLSKLQQHKDVAVKVPTTESQRFMNLKKDTMIVQYQPLLPNSSTISSIRAKEKLSRDKWHYTSFCPSKNHECQLCHKCGHKESFRRHLKAKPSNQIQKQISNSVLQNSRKNRTENGQIQIMCLQLDKFTSNPVKICYCQQGFNPVLV